MLTEGTPAGGCRIVGAAAPCVIGGCCPRCLFPASLDVYLHPYPHLFTPAACLPASLPATLPPCLQVFVPFTREHEYVKEFKQAHRRDDDIAIVNAGMRFRMAQGTGDLNGGGGVLRCSACNTAVRCAAL